MIQTTLFNHFNCNNNNNNRLLKQTNKIKSLLKQTLINDYFAIKPKKNSILNYFKTQEKKNKNVFNLVLVDIENTETETIKCVKKNIYDKELKYIAISYRWGELNEQLVKTPDYTAHITSFDIKDLKRLCYFIKMEPDLKNIQYLWVDAISVNQLDHSRKKETILQMTDIYRKATYILAIPDFHRQYLWKNPANGPVLLLISKYWKTIYQDLHQQQLMNNQEENEKEIITSMKLKKRKSSFNLLKYIMNKSNKNNDNNNDNDNKELMEKEENMKKVYQFLAYLIQDWSNRAWVISEYHIAKEKQEHYRKPLKYTFISLLLYADSSFNDFSFFSYSFDHLHHLSDLKSIQHDTNENHHDNHYKNINYYSMVNSSQQFIQFLRTGFIQRHHLEMILDSNASRNEDRFNAILPSWHGYKHLIENKNTISDWHITDMTSVRLKLYQIMDDLWDKARLLHACSHSPNSAILPSFATDYKSKYLHLIELDNVDYAIEKYSNILLDYQSSSSSLSLNTNNKENDDDDDKKEEKEEEKEEKEKEKEKRKKEMMDQMKNEIENYKNQYDSIYTENIIHIQLNHHYYLTVKSARYFIFKMVKDDNNNNIFDQEFLFNYSLQNGDNDDHLRLVYIPFFTFSIPNYTHVLPISIQGSGISLVGHMDKNRWILIQTVQLLHYTDKYLHRPDTYTSCTDNYTFKIY